ncbi:Glycosyl transferase family 2 [Gemmata sp. SH-PL17]|uniref:glycosyltransferase n=1 Tax=Gemmata sp. SH-PL17 TaxID=1630693 RepID=UPI00078C341F|nr:glycosyltransferase [Gemmata sp. SH-PL17]AMV24603.1 Glycosyl transferase family 2 [Gemmata sp. SH-PL17]
MSTPSDVLTIGMATHREPDHVWFTLTALHANHPRCRYVVVDNSPERCRRTESITRAVGGAYYHRPDLTGTSAPRDAVFRFAETPWVMCIDSHVILETGAVAAAIDYARAHPDSRDIIQGPMIHDDGAGLSTHWNQPAAPGLWGMWERDPRGGDAAGAPFEIPMMGLGLWMMRREAWPGFNPLFRGFGGEEGYTHELVRQRGGRAMCLPALRWRHKFRDTSGFTAPPYPLRLEDHVWNLLVGHREVGIGALPQIHEHFGRRLPEGTWRDLVSRSEAAQPFGGPRPEIERQRILAVWYSDSAPPKQLLAKSILSVTASAAQTGRHDVTVSQCAWDPYIGTGKPEFNSTYSGEKRRGYDTIVAQIRQAVAHATGRGETYDAVAFCEHDVLYPPSYFDRIGDALAANPTAPVVSNLDYIGLNGTGWQRVRERHEPLHQLTLRWDVFQANLARAEREAKTGQPVILEPDHGGQRTNWARLPVGDSTPMPSVHVNHTHGRFTSHGDVCYEPRGYSLTHPHWGEARHWWPGEMTTVANVAQVVAPSGCGACEANKHDTLAKWFAGASAQPSDFHEHVGTLRDLAKMCDSATELSLWQKPADVAIAFGLESEINPGTFTSICPRPKPQWDRLTKWMGGRFTGFAADPASAPVAPTDLLFIDTDHTANALMPLLEAHHERVAKYLVVHCTVTFGETGDRPDAPGVMHALRAFCLKHPEWVVKRHDRNNHGLMVLSRCPEDVKQLPSLWRKAMNYTAAMIRHKAAGSPVVSLEVLEERQGHCATCEDRALDACAACGCPLEAKLPLATETCGLAKKGREPKWKAAA